MQRRNQKQRGEQVAPPGDPAHRLRVQRVNGKQGGGSEGPQPAVSCAAGVSTPKHASGQPPDAERSEQVIDHVHGMGPDGGARTKQLDVQQVGQDDRRSVIGVGPLGDVWGRLQDVCEGLEGLNLLGSHHLVVPHQPAQRSQEEGQSTSQKRQPGVIAEHSVHRCVGGRSGDIHHARR